MNKFVLMNEYGLFVKHDWNVSKLVNNLEDATMFLTFDIAEESKTNVPKYKDFEIKEVKVSYTLLP